jgi:serine O-acetyltransferase
LANYQTHPLRRDHCACGLPSNRKIKDIISLSKRLIYPGFFDDPATGKLTHRRITQRLMNRLGKLTTQQTASALLYIADERKKPAVYPQAKALSSAFLASLPELRSTLLLDLEAHFEGDPAAFNRDEIIVSYPGMYAILIYRFAHRLWELHVPMIPRMMTEYAHRETGIDIHPGAVIGSHFFIDHGTGVVIGETTQIGDHVKIYQGVTLGALSTKGGQDLKGKKRHPTIGDRVTIYAGASILGGETVIGSDTVIASNVFITESVKSGSKVSQKVPELQVKESGVPKKTALENKGESQ